VFFLNIIREGRLKKRGGPQNAEQPPKEGVGAFVKSPIEKVESVSEGGNGGETLTQNDFQGRFNFAVYIKRKTKVPV